MSHKQMFFFFNQYIKANPAENPIGRWLAANMKMKNKCFEEI